MKPNMTLPRLLRITTITAALAAAISGCAMTDFKGEVGAAAEAARKGPESAPQQTITNFSDALRCMDNQLITWSIRDVSILAEEVDDKTKKVAAGTKDMLISAISTMTRRSRAIRLVAFGVDSRSLDEWIRRSQTLAPFAEVPQFAIRGSVSQFDQALARKEGDAGIGYGDKWSVGVARSAGVSRMAIDLNMIFGSNFSIVPGVTSQNSILLFNEGNGIDGDATIKKFGINFSMTLAKSEGQAQALRNLVDLAAIELIGRLTRTPYWVCLGSSAESPEVRKEIEDWFFAMESGGDLIPYIQFQLRNRGYFGGPVDGVPSAELAQAVAMYRLAMSGGAGTPAAAEANGDIDLDFLMRYLSADHARVLAANPPPATPPAPAPAPAPAAAASPGTAEAPAEAPASRVAPSSQGARVARGNAPAASPERLNVSIESVSGEKVFGRGQPVQLSLATNRTAHLHCYMRDDRRQIQRIFPNRFNRDTLVRGGEALALPGNMRFQIIASPRGIAEAIVCYATDTDLIARLPRRITGADFENLPVVSFDEIKQAFRLATNDQFAEGVFHVRTQ